MTVALLTLIAGVARAQDKNPLDGEQRAAVIEDIARSLIDGYIYADKGQEFAEHLETRLAAGAYDSLTTRSAFAGQLSTELFALSNDKHLKIMPTRSRAGATGGAGGGRRVMRRVMRRVGGGEGANAGGASGAEDVSWPGMPDLARVNHGFQELKILEGNVGYLDLRIFSPSPDALARVDASMAFFDSVDALIIDIGQNRGGAGTIVTYFSAYFFPERTHLLDTFQRGMDEPSERWTDAKVTGRLRPDLPVFILTSKGTGSAAESFAFGLKTTKRVTIVGETTAGLGHFGNGMRPLAEGFEMFLPIGRAYDPATGKGFEADGIAPDVDVPYADAFREAHMMAVDAGREYGWMLADRDDGEAEGTPADR